MTEQEHVDYIKELVEKLNYTLYNAKREYNIAAMLIPSWRDVTKEHSEIVSYPDGKQRGELVPRAVAVVQYEPKNTREYI